MKQDISVLGIDLAKNVFQIHGANVHGKRVLSKRVGRKELIELMSNFTPCVVGIEACISGRIGLINTSLMPAALHSL